MSKVVTGDFERNQEDDKKIRIVYNNGHEDILECTYFGVMEGFLDFMGFWKGETDHPFLMVSGSNVSAIEILEEELDNS